MKRQRMDKAGALIAVILVLLMLTTTALAGGGGPTIPRFLIGGGGGHSEVGRYVLDATVGQAIAGAVSARSFALCAGFWCGMGEYRVRLPLILKN